MPWRLALRKIRQRPATFIAVVLVLSLTIAVNSALFSILDGLLFRQLPFFEPDRLVTVDFAPIGGQLPELAYLPELTERRQALRERLLGSPLISGAAQADFAVFFEAREAKALGLRVQGVDSKFFPLFGLSPEVGMTFSLDDERAETVRSTESRVPLPIIIGHDLWRRLFGSDPTILGTHQLAGRLVRIVGVMGKDVKFPNETNVWALEWSTRGWPPTYVRIASETTIQQLQAAFPEFRFRPLREVAHPGEAGAVPVLFGAAVLLLVLTWVQIGSLMFSEGLNERRNIGVRRALGAGRSELLQQFAARAAVTMGVALVAAWIIVGPLTLFVVGTLPSELSRGQYLRPDARTLLFSGAMSLLGFCLLTAIPFLAAARTTPLDLLNDRAGQHHIGSDRTRMTLLGFQMTITALLMYVAGLAAHSFERAVTFDYGFDSEHVLVFSPTRPPASGAGQDQQLADVGAFKQKIQLSVERLQGVPEVIGAANFFSGPLGLANQPGLVHVRLLDEIMTSGEMLVRVNAVGADFVRALGAMMIAGRGFDDPEFAGRDDVIVVNEALARLISPPLKIVGGELAPTVIGRRIRSTNGTGQIIGVVKDLIDAKLDVPAEPQLFSPDRHSLAAAIVLVRINQSTERSVSKIRDSLEPVWGPLSPNQFILLRDELQPVLAPYSSQSILLGLMVACCLPISAIGIISVLTHSVSLRTREIAVRLALGADSKVVRRSIVRRALATVLIGLVCGTILGVASSSVIAHHLFRVQPADPVTMIVVAVGLLILGWCAAWAPALRASRIEPAVALRQL